MDILSLFSGIGGLDIGVHRALARLGIEGRARAYVEGEAFSVGVLAQAMEAGALASAPVWSDVRTFGAATCPGPVDMVIGGFPCQDLSSAGKREGITGERSGLFFELARIVRELEPRYVFLENVRGITVRGLDAVLGELARLGFDAEWACLQAAHVGAPHKRERWFCLAYRNGLRVGEEQQPAQGRRRDADKNSEVMADANGSRLEGWGCEGRRRSNKRAARTSSPEMADANGGRRQERGEPKPRGQQGSPRGEPDGFGEVRQLDDAAFPPGPEDEDGWRRWLASGGPEPAVRGGPDGVPDRVDRLRALGNAVVPQQAEAAFLLLWKRAHKLF